MKNRILQFIGSFNQGGSERQAVGLTRLLKNEGSFDVYAATLNNQGVLRSELAGIGLTEIPEFPLTSFYNANFVKQVRRCANYLRRNEIDIVHTHDFYTNIFGMAAAALAGIDGRVASKRETGGMRSKSQEFIEKAAFGRARAIVANSDAVREHLIGRGFSSAKIKLIYNGLDTARFAEPDRSRPDICRQFGLPTSENLSFVTMVANLRHHVKNVPMLLRAAKRVAETHCDIHFVIAGEGELQNELEDNARRLNISDNVHFIGRCTDVPALLSVAQACVLTSTAEGFSNSILEYMAAGKPVVATNVGGAAEAIVEGETGYLVASDDDLAMSSRLIELLADDEKIAKFGLAGKRIAREKFSQTSQLANTLKLYNSLI